MRRAEPPSGRRTWGAPPRCTLPDSRGSGKLFTRGQGRRYAIKNARELLRQLGAKGIRATGFLPSGREGVTTKIATYNVNGVNGRLPVLLRWLAETWPDIAYLQELKVPPEKFPHAALRAVGYHAIWHGQKSWNGVAILARAGEPVEAARELPGDADDLQSRYLEAMVGGIRIGCLYLPNGNPASGPKFDHKLRWFDRLIAHASGLVKKRTPVILAGDFTVIPTELDVYKPERWVDDALFRPESREAYSRLLAQGWTDAMRHLYPAERIYTFWNYFRNAWGRNAGLRIDHFLLNPTAARRLTEAGVDREVRALEKSSDHAPVWLELKAK